MYLRRSILSCALLLPACGGVSNDTSVTGAVQTTGEPDGSSSGGGGSTTSGTTGVAPVTTGEAPVTTGTSTGSSSGGGFLDPTGGASGQCDVWAQDCPEGEKCSAYADDGSTHWNSTHCVPVVQNAALPGEPCTIEDGVASGIDNCAKGSFCWYMDYNTLEGTCIAACTGSADAPVCPDGRACDISNNGTLLLCLETCDPLVPSCPQDQLCFSSSLGEFICDLDNSGSGGAYGDECAFVNTCNYGLFCSNPEGVPGCNNGSGCCSEFCDLTADPITCQGAPEQTCEPWYDVGTAPPGFEDVGYCTILQ
jgi:hypothetical protein